MYDAGKTSSETAKLVQIAYGDKTLSVANIYVWYRKFINDRESSEHSPMCGHPVVAKTEELVGLVEEMLGISRGIKGGTWLKTWILVQDLHSRYLEKFLK